MSLTRRQAASLLTAAPLALATPAQAATHQVRIRSMQFQPATLSVKAGDTVTWTNSDGVEHTATARDNSWGTESLRNGKSGSITFSTPGEYSYFCKWHPAMRGKIVVT